MMMHVDELVMQSANIVEITLETQPIDQGH